MSAVQDHYEKILADHYTWLYADDFGTKVREQADLLRRMGVDRPRVALDLGCGSGFQSFALKSLGAERVLAVDTSEQLLAELQRQEPDGGIECFHRDLTDFASFVRDPVDVAVCMGDTLTHLERREDVTRLFDELARTLAVGSRLVLGYRDLSTVLDGLDRFIPLRSSDDKIMTCFLERDGDRVTVHDLIHLREESGWVLRKSAYPKLVLPFAALVEELAGFGFDLEAHEGQSGMHALGLLRR